jgi:DNA-binding NarL/FixJ family response regulator
MGNNGQSIRVLIADDHPILREGLTKLLEGEQGIAVVGAAADGEEAVMLTRSLSPDILLLDLDMPRMPGLDVLRELSGSPVPTRVILLTAMIEQRDIGKALQLGARGVVLKSVATKLLFKSIRCVMNGEYWLGRGAVADLVAALREVREESPRRAPYGLTPREVQVVGAVVQGLTNREIAQRLVVSEDTVKHHITNIFDKLGVSNRLELALFAVNHQLASQA